MKDTTFYRRLLLLALPIALQNIITFSVGLVDNIMVGSLGETAISGVYICNQIQTMLQMLVVGCGAALIVLAAQYWGKGDEKSVKNIIGIALKFVLICAGLLWIVVFFSPYRLFGLFTDNRQVLGQAVIYARIICFSYLFFGISNVLIASLRCIRVVKIGLYISISTFIVNIFLNWVFIFGNLGAPALGIRGSAVATLTARVIECVIVLSYLKFVDKKLQVHMTDLIHNNMVLLRDFFRYGFPVILGDVLWGLNLSVQGAIVGRMGSDSIAAVSIANIVFSLISVGVYGTANASAVIIGNAVGEGDINVVKQYAKKLQFVFLVVGIITGIVLFFVKDYVLLLYNVADETRSIARALMIILSVTVVGTSYQMSSLTGIVRAGGATHFVLINDIIFVWCIVIPSSLLAAFVFKAPAWIVFLCLKCDQILKCAVAVVKVNRFDWVRKLTKEFQTSQA